MGETFKADMFRPVFSGPMGWVNNYKLTYPSHDGYDWDIGWTVHTIDSWAWDDSAVLEPLLRYHIPMDRYKDRDGNVRYVTEKLDYEHVQIALDNGCWTAKGYCRTGNVDQLTQLDNDFHDPIEWTPKPDGKLPKGLPAGNAMDWE
jgi:hypothetical protein